MAGELQQLSVEVLRGAGDEDNEDVDAGMLNAFIATDTVDEKLHLELKALRGERDRWARALRFAGQMRSLLEGSEAHCPICFMAAVDCDALAVLPDCFHVLCRGCLQHNL